MCNGNYPPLTVLYTRAHNCECMLLRFVILLVAKGFLHQKFSCTHKLTGLVKLAQQRNCATSIVRSGAPAIIRLLFITSLNCDLGDGVNISLVDFNPGRSLHPFLVSVNLESF